jgi:hypothetical protein
MMSEETRTRSALPGRTAAVIAALMVLTAMLFWVASAVEKSGARASAPAQTRTEEGRDEAPAPEGSSEKESHEAAAGQSETQALGLNLEAPWVPYAVVIETIVVVLALIFLGYPVLFLVILLSIAGIVLDARELIHQVGASRLGLSSLVAVVALTRVAAAAVALAALIRRRRPTQAG